MAILASRVPQLGGRPTSEWKGQYHRVSCAIKASNTVAAQRPRDRPAYVLLLIMALHTLTFRQLAISDVYLNAKAFYGSWLDPMAGAGGL